MALRPILPAWPKGALFALLTLAMSAHAQQVRLAPEMPLPFGLFQQEPRPLELTPPHVDVISGATANRLAQARTLVDERNWDEAVDLFRDLSAESGDQLVALDDGRFLSLRAFCQWQLSHLPAEALASYRRRVDPLAERWYRQGLAARDERQLRRVVDEMFCSSWGDDALLALGELALERGHYAAARRYWQQISPLLRDPNGRPVWLSLRGIDLDRHWPEIERRWPQRSQPPAWLAYPDTQLNLADVRARLVLASIRSGDLERARLELDTLQRWHPQAVGRLGGLEGPYAAALQRLLNSADQWPDPLRQQLQNWPTFAGATSRSPHAPAIGRLARTSWRKAVSLSAQARGRFIGAAAPVDDGQRVAVHESQRPISVFPIVFNHRLLYADATSVHAVDLATGKPAITPDGELYRVEATAGDLNAAAMRQQAIASGVPRYTLSIVDGVVYARLGQPTTARLQPVRSPVGERIVGLDLRRDGLLVFQVRPDDERWSFDGVPVGDGRRVYVAMRHGDVAPHAYVACFDAATGRRLWRTSIGAADTPATGRGDEITHNLLTLVEDRLYFNTNLGLIASLDAETGQIYWLRSYQRHADGPADDGLAGPLHLDRDPSPCLVQDGIVVVAPSDTPSVFALDDDTGRMLWTTDQLAGALHLLAVVDGGLIAAGKRLWSLDLRSGQVRFVWPESEHAGIRGIGRGVVAGHEVFWPTRKEIYVLDARTGARTRPPIDLTELSDGGANLATAHGYLVVAGRDRLIATGPRAAGPDSESDKTAKVANAN